ncbi:MAG: CdaR family protein [Thermincolia bacterium]
MTNFYRRNGSIKVVSILLALLLWVYVGNLQNPTGDRVIPNVPLEHRGLSSELAVSAIQSTVTVRVQGLSSALNTLSPRDIKAYVSLEEAHPGVNWRPVKVTGIPSGLRLASVQPEQVKVDITTIGRKQVYINIEYLGKTAPGYGVAQPVLKPEVVVVRGPVEKLDQVARAMVTVELRGGKNELVEYLPVQLIDGKGGAVDSRLVQFEPKVVEVRVPITKNPVSLELPIRAVLQGEPANGFRVERVVVSPAKVMASGEGKSLQGLKEALTMPIDVTGKDGDFTVEVGLKAPAGVTFDKPKVRVEVKLKDLEERVPGEVYREHLP